MSDEQEEALPTALVRDEDGALFSYRHTNLVDLKDGDELVRRKDVKALIQAKLREIQREKKPINQGFSNLINGWTQAFERIEEELLEELKQSDVEKKGGEQ